ncbi:MAG: MgtC/SapB family protein [Thiobacillaceae bacterium]
MNPSDWTVPDLEVLLRYGTALAIGLLMGLERERNPSARAGLRTFALVALFGVMAAQLGQETASPWLVAVGLFLVGVMIIAAYFRQPDKQGDPGTTTVGAMLVCYGLGVLCWFGEIRLAVMLGIASTVLLYFKTELHGITQSLTRRDLISILQFAVLSLIVLPLLPNHGYGPYGALNPHQIWWMVLLISGLSLAGYAAFRIAGQKRGTILIGLLGGLVSSTATTLSFSRHSKQNEALARLAVIVIVLANLVVLARLAVLVGVLSVPALAKLAPILATGLVTGTLAAWYGLRKFKPMGEAPELVLSNPTEIRTALTFGALYAGVLLASAWLADLAGPRGLYAVASVAGLTDVDAITLSTLRLFNLGKVQIEAATFAIILAFISNLVFKSALVWTIAGWNVARHAIAGMGAIALGLGLAWAVSYTFS